MTWTNQSNLLRLRLLALSGAWFVSVAGRRPM